MFCYHFSPPRRYPVTETFEERAAVEFLAASRM